MNIAIIPARGGSKRIPGKNIKDFSGLPIIAWSVKAARDAQIFDRIIVSTDDPEIKAISEQYGAEVPFMRPDDLSDDFTATAPVITHAINEVKEDIPDISWACCIYPCAPLIFFDDIKESLKIAIENDAEFIYPVSEFPVPPQWALKLTKNNYIEYLHPGSALIRSQDLEKLYFDAGQFYWGKVESWLARKDMHSCGVGFPIPNFRVSDIDTLDDWKRAELIFRHLRKENQSQPS